ncbi:hypothetical protein [Mesorhizobium kowhaii]|uniref:hypothetical protein n=1 Tax=Mesorhizobium kowhaii TaxID=1300272 RepID=UPI001FE221A6|nr:hypothetical protein [Mesorhizobium kowhaii]
MKQLAENRRPAGLRREVRSHDGVVENWELLTEDEAIEAAIDKHGKDPTTSVAYCAMEVSGNADDPEGSICF